VQETGRLAGMRGHQFNKVEMSRFTAPGQAEGALTEFAGCAQGLVEKLGLHHQTTLPATRDASASMRLTCDIEVWLPSIGICKEVSCASGPVTTRPAAPASATAPDRASRPPASAP
jgi:seryl-tRNA synthetase